MIRFDYSGGINAKGPAIFMDRDGVINCRRPNDYVLNFSQFVFVPGIRAALKQLASLRLPIIVISNQAAVGKGLLDHGGLEEISARMHQALLGDGTTLTAAYYCPHRQEENCSCRKPRPGLLHRAAGDFGIDLKRSIFIGDSDSDVEAAWAAGVSPILFRPEAERSVGIREVPMAIKAEELFEIAALCLREAEAVQARRAPIAAKT
jgi:D-glycero-D-manno-heptose 1,7-bisphosphate phosphatase